MTQKEEKTIKKLYIKHEEYLNEAEEIRETTGQNADYWEGKASGILLAIEIIQGKWN